MMFQNKSGMFQKRKTDDQRQEEEEKKQTQPQHVASYLDIDEINSIPRE
jgi:hypothetical protein